MKKNMGRRGSIAQPFISLLTKSKISKLKAPLVLRDKSNASEASAMGTKKSIVSTLESLTSLPDETSIDESGINNITIMNSAAIRAKK